MSKLFNEAGFLSDEGQRVFREVLDGKVKMILCQAANETELRIIGSLICQRVGNLVANNIEEHKAQEGISDPKKLSEELETCTNITEEGANARKFLLDDHGLYVPNTGYTP